ncbi:hypothetical protein [Phyllobacterium lublinensis]|jgi:hypothetical protein|uniref:hypothetical protein n=1 Tax=Phyllobacterium lublinensis TaxID=2875708 RepID=UPI001CCDF29A|nr:hypothetical protein [Phyllobacterium sp. 2063]MBZ9656222.1 hypothetical protein [Phyllobacterium sp. 2063]
MRFVIMSLIGIAVIASPCVYDSDPRETTAIAAMIVKLSTPGTELDLVNDKVSAIVP